MVKGEHKSDSAPSKADEEKILRLAIIEEINRGLRVLGL